MLIVGYRVDSGAWPDAFIDTLARRFTVITFDNRGTGQSDKPVTGYALANMARDLFDLLGELGITSTCLLGYSMGGAIAQEFVRQFPEHVSGLILCATMCGGSQAIYAKQSVVRVMRDLDGLSAEEIARQIWKVTYAPHHLANHREAIENQMRREIVHPTPLHAADLQFSGVCGIRRVGSACRYRLPAAELSVLYDRLVGIKGALLGEAGHQTLEIPMFRMTPGAETAIMRHGAADTTGDPRRSTLKTTADWTKALERLIESPNADLSDLIAEWKT